MKNLGYLTPNQLKYVLFHIEKYYTLPKAYSNDIQFINGKTVEVSPNTIYFELTDNPINYDSLRYLGNIPILFPDFNHAQFYEIQNNALIFHDDILKSAFYLLSGYQEYLRTEPDYLNRYNYEYSIHKRLNITSLPVVNYYFDFIVEALNKFYRISDKGFKIRRKVYFNDFGFMLSHDIDRIQYNNLNSLIYKAKQILGLTTNPYTRKQSFQQLGSILIGLFQPINKDPYWNFEDMIHYEMRRGIRSTWFFLPKNDKHTDSYYTFSNKKIQYLFRLLKNSHHEIGLHGTVQSSKDINHMLSIKEKLEYYSSIKVNGVRQHRLMYCQESTPCIHEQAGFKYDTTLGFPHHEGFRNSMCLPFRLYNFKEDKMFNYWEIPLIVMDNTLFFYRKLDFEEARNIIFKLIDEIRKFNGLFTLLWHNHYFDEHLYPGISNFYKQVIESIINLHSNTLTGNEILNILEADLWE